MNYPLNISFKIISFASQFHVTEEQSGNQICYVRQKILKLKEAVEVFTDDSKTSKICDIKADRVLDFSACY
ncbi:MAG: hypothetical protein AAF226_19125, partial [Verrucomicrobiota bacterium]